MNELIDAHITFRWVGRGVQFLNGVPARDLTDADLLEIEEREGITETEIERCGLYARAELAEVEPFCGAETDAGGRCRRVVAAWGEHCWQHGDELEIGEVDDGTERIQTDSD